MGEDVKKTGFYKFCLVILIIFSTIYICKMGYKFGRWMHNNTHQTT